MTLLRLYNPMTQETTEIVVSEAEAQRAENDLECATQLLELSQSQVRPVSSTIASSCNISEDGTFPSNVGEAVNVFKWSHEAILLLIEEFRKEQENLSSGRVSQKKVWEKISKALHENGHIGITGPQCLSKFNGMKRTDKSIKDHNSKSGNNLRSWPYLDRMESVLGEKPYMQPVATLSSTRGEAADAGSSTILTAAEDIISPRSRNSRKRKATTDIAEAIIESRRMAEESKDRRHQEKLKQKGEFQQNILDMMGALINKI